MSKKTALHSALRLGGHCCCPGAIHHMLSIPPGVLALSSALMLLADSPHTIIAPEAASTTPKSN